MTNANSQPQRPGNGGPAVNTVTNKLRVMIVEDETLVGMGLRKDLERLGHTVVAHASNADDARREYTDKKPDLVFMDIRLDGADGIELAAELLQQQRCPMIILS